jgi:hypothetical protein
MPCRSLQFAYLVNWAGNTQTPPHNKIISIYYQYYAGDRTPCFVYLMTAANFHINNSMCCADFQVIRNSICGHKFCSVIFHTEDYLRIQRHWTLFLMFHETCRINLMCMFHTTYSFSSILKSYTRTQCFS